jgi:hypothetical protein
MSSRPTFTHILAIAAAACLAGALFLVGVAAACEGGGINCNQAPSVTTTAATGVSYTSAYLNGQVDPHGCHTTYYFEIKKGETWIPHNPKTLLSESIAEEVSEWEPSLEPGTKYEFRLNANNVKGTTPGSAVSFTTPNEPPKGEKPSVTTEAASGITSFGATLNGSVNPHGLSTTYQFEFGTTKGSFTNATPPVNIGSGTTSQKVKAEVGLEPGTVYYFRITAANEAGTSSPGSELSFTTSTSTWKIKSSPNPVGASDTDLYDVSCEPSTGVCTAVGQSTISGVENPLAQRWNGSTWSEQTPAKKSGATHNRLFGVDCPSETRCLAVGNYQASEGATVLAETWNESKWSVQSPPVPSGSSSSEFRAIGCNNTVECTAAGSAVVGGVTKAIVEEWNNPVWTQATIPIPEGATSSQFDGVDCLWWNFCVAVGRYTTSGGTVKSLVEFWNGTNWALQTVTDPVGATQSTLLDVACTPSPNRCMAVGGWKKGTTQFTLAYRFDGVSTWTLQSTPNPAGSIASVFQEVSCPTETSCTGAGSWVSSSGGSNRTLAEAWNGTSWSLQGTPNPSGAVFSAFFGLSCRSTTCMGVGWSTNSSGTDTTLSEFRE